MEFGYKSNEYQDSMLNEDIAVTLGAATRRDLKEMRRITPEVSKILRGASYPRG